MLVVVRRIFGAICAKYRSATNSKKPCRNTVSNSPVVLEFGIGSRTAEGTLSSKDDDSRSHRSLLLIGESLPEVPTPFTRQRALSAPDLRSLELENLPKYSSYDPCPATFSSEISGLSDQRNDVFKKLSDCERGEVGPAGPVRTLSFKY